MALDQAVRRDLVACNVAALTDTPDGPTSEGRSLTVEQANVLLDAANGDRLEAAYLTLLMLGLRPGELLGLPRDAVDTDAEQMKVRQALTVERGSKVVIGPVKTPGSRRTLALPRQVAEALRAHRRRQLEERLAAGPNWVDSGLVFTTFVGTPIHPRNFRRSFTHLTERAGLGPWHPHELRHSAVSLLSAAGVREEDVADVVGHVTTRMTHQVYRHQVAPAITAGKEAMERLFASDSRTGSENRPAEPADV
ncbi:MAG: site-specific integrase [Actinomycetota bacterium]|nr:site-specific integrase [Actinomycetota bacterium]